MDIADKTFLIDAETRVINIPDGEGNLGVEGDVGTGHKYFKCPRIVGDDGIDLNEHQIYISYVKTNTAKATKFVGDPALYHCNDVALDETGDYVTFSWEMSGDVFKTQGLIAFKVMAKKTDGESVKTCWNTRPAVGTVLMTLPDGIEGITELYPDIITQLLDRMDAVEEIATEEAMQGYVEKYLGEHPVQLDSTLTDPEKAAPADAVGELKSEMGNLFDINQPTLSVFPSDANGKLNDLSYSYSMDNRILSLNTDGDVLATTTYIKIDPEIFDDGEDYCVCLNAIDGNFGNIYLRVKVGSTYTSNLIGKNGTVISKTDDLSEIKLQFIKNLSYTGTARLYAVRGSEYKAYQDKSYEIRSDVAIPRIDGEFGYAVSRAYFNPFDYGFLRISYNGTKFAPPNTVIGVATSAFLGYRAIKGDVRKCADGYVMCHDATLNQTTMGTGNLIDYPVEEIKKYPLKKQTDGFTGSVYIDTFEDWLLACKNHCITPFINFKDDLTDNRFACEAADCLEIITRYGMADKCVIQAFAFDNLDKIRSLSDKVMMMKVMYQGNVFRLSGAAQYPQRIKSLYPCGVILFDNSSEEEALRGDDVVGGPTDYKNHASYHYFDDFNLINDETMIYCRENRIPIEAAICYSFAMDKIVQTKGLDGVMTDASYNLPRRNIVFVVRVDTNGDTIAFSTSDGEVHAEQNNDGSYVIEIGGLTSNLIHWFSPILESDCCTVHAESGRIIVTNVENSGFIRICM